MFIGASDPGPFGDFGSSWFEIYNMILGNYQPDDIFGANPANYKYNGTGQNNSTYSHSSIGVIDTNTMYNGTILFEPSYTVADYRNRYVLYVL
jgi:hypothetical protein